MGRKAARRRECKTVHSQGYKIVNSRARRETRKRAIRRTAARAIPKARGLRVVALRVAVPRVVGPRAGILRVAVPRAVALRLGIRRAGVLKPGSAVLKGSLNSPMPDSPTLNNLGLSNPRSGHPT
jgi:hypothetical protein